MQSGRWSLASVHRLVYVVLFSEKYFKTNLSVAFIFSVLLIATPLILQQPCKLYKTNGCRADWVWLRFCNSRCPDRLVTNKMNASVSSQPGSTPSSCVKRQLRQHTPQVCKRKCLSVVIWLCDWMVGISWLKCWGRFFSGLLWWWIKV